MRRPGLLALVILCGVAPGALVYGSANIPDWVRNAAHEPLPAYAPDTPGVVVYDQTTVTVMESGEIRTHHYVACKILGTAGRDLGYASVHFDSMTRLAGFTAWSIAANGDEYEVRERDAAETSAVDGELYADQKLKIIRIPAANPGTLFAYEYEVRESQPQALQDSWHFQREVPVRWARYTVVLPKGWTHEERWFNAAPKAPQISETAVAWQVSDVPAIRDEAGRPPMAAVAGRMAINFVSPSGAKVARNWSDLGRWYTGLVGDRRAATPELQAKVRELTANHVTTLDKMRALAAFAQKDIRYVAIEIGIGGYQPHAAGEIFRNRYGDCKDKVTALGAMLREIGVPSYYVIVSTSRGVVDRQFASIEGFDHAIIAMPLSPDMKSPDLHGVIEHPTLGRLLLFDPTNEHVAFGDLPPYLQANQGLLVTADGGDLIEMPAQQPETSQLRRTAKLTLDMRGGLTGTVSEAWTGALAAGQRYYLARRNTADRVKLIEDRVSFHLADFKVSDLAIENLDDLSKDLVVRYSLSAPVYAKIAGSLMLVRPRVLGQKAERVLDLKERAHGYETEGPSLQSDDIQITIPSELDVDELPAPTKLSTPILTYVSEATFKENALHYRREYRVKDFDVPLAGLPELNKAFSSILADERSSAVFKKKSEG